MPTNKPQKPGAGFQRGFTLVELVMTMIVVGILAAMAVPRFFDSNIFQSRGFADQVLASLRYAQKAAIAQHRVVCVAFAADSVTLMIDSDTPPDGACNANLQSPAGDASYVIPAPDGIAFGTPQPTNFSFDALGRPNPNARQTFTIVGATNPIVVEAETGYVHWGVP